MWARIAVKPVPIVVSITGPNPTVTSRTGSRGIRGLAALTSSVRDAMTTVRVGTIAAVAAVAVVRVRRAAGGILFAPAMVGAVAAGDRLMPMPSVSGP